MGRVVSSSQADLRLKITSVCTAVMPVIVNTGKTLNFTIILYPYQVTIVPLIFG
jgi:hypothetical protein